MVDLNVKINLQFLLITRTSELILRNSCSFGSVSAYMDYFDTYKIDDIIRSTATVCQFRNFTISF